MPANYLSLQQQTISLKSTSNLKARHNWPTVRHPKPSQPIFTAQPKLGIAVAKSLTGHTAFL